MEHTLTGRLYAKMEREQNAFIAKLKSYPPEVILDRAYEKVVRDDFLMVMESMDLSTPQLKALLSLEKTVASLYDEWLDNNFSYMDMVRDTLEYGATKHLKDMLERKKDKGVER